MQQTRRLGEQLAQREASHTWGVLAEPGALWWQGLDEEEEGHWGELWEFGYSRR